MHQANLVFPHFSELFVSQLWKTDKLSQVTLVHIGKTHGSAAKRARIDVAFIQDNNCVVPQVSRNSAPHIIQRGICILKKLKVVNADSLLTSLAIIEIQ
tara:strand:- start:320 stop:616 length:297 start_codon:yes stop_codon:yes gene_type:complete